ncbi:hypothetical protein SAMN05216215_109713 [Saccharopolyspora shandongensis]|uniref:Uncharacterized protein n=1 Tax=Saccharopolyspora shandongensis TaxID=418495 RepID=A0A1H3U073_9PSEU|nr:hypothetical protein [Saccharopolyspora shandongensis]SDZ55255.1 hypothetical protein SAMN05216215_109713 [Saccharopolyspora shandongensis]
MSQTEIMLLVVLVVACALVVTGVALIAVAAAFILAGLFTAALGFFFLTEVGR